MSTKKTNQVKRRQRAGEAVPLADRVAKSRAALEKRGGARIPSGWLQPEPAKALHYLHARGFDPTRVGCISRALVEAAETLQKRARSPHKKP